MVSTKTVGLFICAVCLVSLCSVSITLAETSEPTVTVSDTTLEPNETSEVGIRLAEAPNGLAGYNLTLSIADALTGEFTTAEYGSGFEITEEPRYTDVNSSVQLRAVDVQDPPSPNASDVLLATVTVKGENQGETSFTVDVTRMDDDDGGEVDPSIEPGTLTVEDESDIPTPTPAPETSEVDADPSDLPGDGTQTNPYEISNVSELQAMEHDLTANYTLITDIDASDTAQWNSGSGFDPIGSDSSQHITPPFSGSLNGDHHTITGMTIDRSTEAGVGVIGVALSASVTNISFKKHTLTGRTQTGGVIGLSSTSTVQNVTVSGDIDGSLGVGGVVGFARRQHRIQDVTISGSVSGESIVGGVVGNNNHSVIQDVTVSGEITGSDAVGGLVGRNNDGLIQNVTSSGSISGGSSVGGGIGFNAADGTIQNATIFADASGQNGVGGVVGSNQGIIQNTTASGGLNGSTAVVGIVGFTDDTSKIQSATTFSNVTGVVFVGGSIGLSSGSTVRNAVTGTDVNGSIMLVG